MHNRKLSRFASLTVAAGLVFCSFQASPEDIDIFSVDESGIVARPNVIIVLDNSANWSRASQQWPDADTQGESEAFAIQSVINDPAVGSDLNVGLMEYITGGSAGDADSGYVRFHIRPMSTDNKATLSGHLDTIKANINAPDEKRSSGNPFGNLMWDVYNYLAGEAHSNAGAGTLASLADASAYASAYDKFQSPLTSADTCTRTVVIFIGNNVSTGPTVDSDVNKQALYDLAEAANGATAAARAITQLPMAEYVVETTTETQAFGFSEACYTSAAACTTDLVNRDADNNGLKDCAENGYLSCTCDADNNAPCTTSTKWSVVGRNKESTPKEIQPPTPQPPEDNVDTGDIVQVCKNDQQADDLNPTVCPASTTTNVTDPDTGETTTTLTEWSNCAYTSIGSTGCVGGKLNYQKQGTRTRTISVTGTDDTIVETVIGDSAACYFDAATCTADAGGVTCDSNTYSEGCECVSAVTSIGCGGGDNFQELGTYSFIESSQTGTFGASPGQYMMDEWARFLRQTGVLVPGAGGARTQVTTYTIDAFNAQQNADFSALLFNAARVGGGKYFQAKNQDALITALKQILTEVQAVNSAFSSASLPVNATNRAQNQNQVFIGVFKPDRTKNPDWFGNLKQYKLISTGATVELGDQNGDPAVNEQTGFITDCAVSFWTTDSTFEGIAYWTDPSTTNPLPESDCSTAAEPLSDLPDGPFVEKGAAAEVLRKGNNPAATPDDDGNYALNRTVYTITSGALADFDTTNTGLGLDEKLVLFTRGQDIRDEDSDELLSPLGGGLTEPRSTIHGDVVHSRPQPLNYGGDTEVVVYYGSNDGHFRAVRAEDGVELWSFVAPEHYDKLQRLFDNSPGILYYGDVDAPPENRSKDYFFDGSTGVYQTFTTDADGRSVSDIAYIFPSMRRGGAKIYGFNVSDPAKPEYLWSRGCSVNYSTGAYESCDAGFESIGQTWSLPNVALIKGYCGADGCGVAGATQLPVAVFGGGYDVCDDEDTSTPCNAARGQGVYVVDATDGTLLQHFDFSSLGNARGIAADVALIDIDNDGMVDYGYAVDTGGSVYRLDFIDNPTDKTALEQGKWTGSRVAYTTSTDVGDTDDPRKFLFAPALVQARSDLVYVAVGTGDREHPLISQYPYGDEGFPDTAVLNRFYVFKDDLDDVDDGTATDLDGSDMADYSDSNACGTAAITPNHAKKGWYIDLNEQGQGEQVVTSAVIAAGFVFFSTNRPAPVADDAVCTTSLGEARGYFLNLLNGSGAISVTGACGGTRSSTFVGGGLPPSPVLATVPIEGVGLRTVVIGAVQKTGEPSSPIEAQRVRPPIPSDRKPIYWYKSTGER